MSHEFVDHNFKDDLDRALGHTAQSLPSRKFVKFKTLGHPRAEDNAKLPTHQLQEAKSSAVVATCTVLMFGTKARIWPKTCHSLRSC